ncbi:uncharacterized protein LOC121997743 [Zingiber officinale]|uniref:DUF4378 domain-containing protein n=1 Tax=Zingiber officinale TaxID=94328 RepID=A0A8J5L591_ZINOF|nr:uncharacterized protein LOC121997743 [Zingiber officinale]KAG6501205.1 hypothetical protein ZIOFF_041080 [Zingiber officinale]
MDGAGFQSGGWRRRKRGSRIGFGGSGRLVTSSLPKLGLDHPRDGSYFNVESDSTSSSGYRTEESSSSDKQADRGQISRDLAEKLANAEDTKYCLPSMIEKLMHTDDLHSAGIIPKKQRTICSWGLTKMDKGNTNPIQTSFMNLQKTKVNLVSRQHKCVGPIGFPVNEPLSGREQSSNYLEEQSFAGDNINSIRERTSCLFSQSLKEHSQFRLAKLQYTGKSFQRIHPSQVSMLKHNLKKDYKTGGDVLLPNQSANLQLSNRAQETRLRFIEFHSKGRGHLSVPSNMKKFVSKTRNSREVAKSVKKLVGQSVDVGTRTPGALGLGSRYESNDDFRMFTKKLYSRHKNYYSYSRSFTRNGIMHNREKLQHKLPSYDLQVCEDGKVPELDLPGSAIAAVSDDGNLDDVDILSPNIRHMDEEARIDTHSIKNEDNISSHPEVLGQAQISKSNTEVTCDDNSEVLRLPNVDVENLRSLQQSEDLREFVNERVRDSYLLDIFLHPGACCAKKRKLFDANYLMECGTGTGLFEKLEKKYNKPVSWSSSERKLIVDLLISILAESLSACVYLHPWTNSTRKIEPILCFQGTTENAQEMVLDPKWLDLGNDVHEMGKDIAQMLQEELLDDLVSEFISCYDGFC